MTNCSVSVIIPLYDAEKYIRQCLISVLASKFTDYEVLVVNDCSTDNSVEEVKKLLPHFDGRLKILSTKKNSGGAGIPRNVGIKNAVGKYITFVDNDDFIMPTALGEFFELAEEFQADVVHTEKCLVFNDRGETKFKWEELGVQSDEPHDEFVDVPTLETDDLGERINRYLRGKFFWLPWGKFYRREFLIKNKIDFLQVRFSEDMVFCFKCMCLAEKYLRVPNITNIHRVLESSTSKQSYEVRIALEVMTKVVAEVDKFMSKLTFFKDNQSSRSQVVEYFLRTHFPVAKNFSQNISPHELQKILFDEWQNPKLDSRGKNLVVAYLLTEKTLTR
ncbi:MAG: glycosyltransferase family 2 protein [Selenomonadaceae bacterium]|nr:glycosyltransferase family 2 protein [Selenomonadaceae bacterium]